MVDGELVRQSLVRISSDPWAEGPQTGLLILGSLLQFKRYSCVYQLFWLQNKNIHKKYHSTHTQAHSQAWGFQIRIPSSGFCMKWLSRKWNRNKSHIIKISEQLEALAKQICRPQNSLEAGVKIVFTVHCVVCVCLSLFVHMFKKGSWLKTVPRESKMEELDGGNISWHFPA